MFLPEAVQGTNALDLLNIHANGTLRPQRADFELLLNILKAYQSQQANRGSINPDRLAPYCLGSFVTAMGDLLASKQPQRTSYHLKRIVGQTPESFRISRES
jgi:hypothetical protein